MRATIYSLTAAYLAVVGSASPIAIGSNVTLPFSLTLNLNGSTMAELDRARAQHLMHHGQKMEAYEKQDNLDRLGHGGNLTRRASSISVTNTAITYTASVKIGSPATSYTLLIDTGSSNTWVGAKQKYNKTSTSTSTGNKVSLSYGSGSFSGIECE